jgi:hypothetical protein
MPSPLSDHKFAKLVGLSEAKKQLAQLPDIVALAAYRPIKASTDAMAMTAAQLAPRRPKDPSTGYTGGALIEHIVGRTSKKHLIGMVGIEKFSVVVVGGRMHAITKSTSVKTRRIKKDGTTVEGWRRRYIGNEARAKVSARGGEVIQPTRYGHLVEFGHRGSATTGKRGGARATAPHSFLRVAARQHQSAFESDMRSITPDVIAALKQLGNAGGTT